MIDSGKRLVTFLDNGADASIPYLIDGMYCRQLHLIVNLKPSKNSQIFGRRPLMLLILLLIAMSTGQKETLRPKCT